MQPRSTLRRSRILMAIAIGVIVAVSVGYAGLRSPYWTEAKNGPESTIGKSGDMKSPGGEVEKVGRRS
jgi:hypothetical protein